MMRLSLHPIFPLILVLVGIGWPAADCVLGVDFTTEIRPLLSNRCFACHGPDEDERAAGLRLDTVDGAMEDLGGYAAIIPGAAGDSELIARVLTDDPGMRMPPPEKGEGLTRQEVDLLRRWIDEGAEYESHWSYQAPVQAEVPDPGSRHQLRNPIDCFVADKLNQFGWSSAEEADRAALARRVSLDLIGLPPSWAQTESFLRDTRPDAYVRLVDALLGNPAFGERWARVWLDMARYADSAGYADDPERTIWAYRDYVIDAFNDSKPFDVFTREQLAGDLLPVTGDHHIDQQRLIATAFHRNTMTNNEGGTSNEEFRNEAVVDRTNTTFAVWMGTTMACAQCHTHKFDPIKHEEYFQIHAFFNNTADNDLKDESPVIEVLTEDQRQERARRQAALTAAQDQFREHYPQHSVALKQSFGVFAATLEADVIRPVTAKSTSRDLTIDSAGSVMASKRPNSTSDVLTFERSLLPNAPVRVLRLAVLPDQKQNFVLTGVTLQIVKDGTVVRAVPIRSWGADYSQKGFEASGAFDEGDRGKRGWAIGGQTGKPHWLTLVLADPLPDDESFELVLDQRHGKHKRHVLQAYQVEVVSGENAGVLLDLEKIQRLSDQVDAVQPVTTVPIMKEITGDNRRRTFVQIRGNYQATADEVQPGTPEALHPMELDRDRVPNRLDLADWLVDRNNPLTARVIANRHWEQLFGIGIVATSEEFGSQGELPTHPELLDHLAIELQNGGWDLKRMLREIVTSHTYRQSSSVDAAKSERDPANRFLARGPRHRISAEMVRDQALSVAGLLCSDLHGPPVKPPQPNLGLKAAFGSATDWSTSPGGDRYRRGLYTMWRRSSPYPSMAAFDAPTREVCLVKRDQTNTPLQALVTLNDPVYVEAAQSLARLLIKASPNDPERIRIAFRRVLLRDPSAEETDRLVQLLGRMRREYTTDLDRATKMAEDPIGPLATREGQDVNSFIVDHAAWTVVGNVLLNLDEAFMKR